MFRSVPTARHLRSVFDEISYFPQRGQIHRLGPTAFRERIHQDLGLLLAPQEVTLVMKKFDMNDSGLVNIGEVNFSFSTHLPSHSSLHSLADVYGNALLISSKKTKPKPNRLLPLPSGRPISASMTPPPHQVIVRKGIVGSRGGERNGGKKLPPVLVPGPGNDSHPVSAVGGKEAQKELYKKCVLRLAQIPGLILSSHPTDSPTLLF